MEDKNSQRCYFAWENLQWAFCDIGCRLLIHFCSSFCCCSSFILFFIFVFVLHSLLFNVIPHPSVDYRRVFTLILYFQSSPSLSDSRHFHFNLSEIFFHSFTASATVLRGYFLPTGVFYLTLELHRHFTCIYQDLPGSRQFFLEVCRTSYWSSKHRPGPSVYLIHSNPQCSYSEEFIFKFYHILWWITCGKKFSLYAPYSFRTLFACSKCYVKTIITCYCLKLLRGTLF